MFLSFLCSRPAGNDVWGWTDPETGRWYAIAGSTGATTFMDVTDPEEPIPVGFLNTTTLVPLPQTIIKCY